MPNRNTVIAISLSPIYNFNETSIFRRFSFTLFYLLDFMRQVEYNTMRKVDFSSP